MAFPDKTLDSSLYGGSWDSNFPLSNLCIKDMALRARSSNLLTTSTTFDGDLGSITKLRVLGIPGGHNFSISATIRVRFSTVPNFATSVYDSGTVAVYPNYYDDSSLDWGQPVLTGGKPNTTHAINMRYPIFFVAPTSVNASYYRVEVVDNNNPAGYIELRRCFVSPGLQASVKLEVGASWGLDNLTRESKSLNGTPQYDRIESPRNVVFTLNNITPEVGSGQYLEASRILGTDQELFFIANPDATSMSMRIQSFMGRLRQLAPYEYVTGTAVGMGYQIVESI
jgi:hypothetical protein